MLKTNTLLLETKHCPIIKPQRRFLGPWSWKNSKNDKNFQKTWKKLQKLVAFCVFVFVVPNHKAQKIVIKDKFVSKKAFFNF